MSRLKSIVIVAAFGITSCGYTLITPKCYDEASKLCEPNGGLKCIVSYNNSINSYYNVICNNGLRMNKNCINTEE